MFPAILILPLIAGALLFVAMLATNPFSAEAAA